MSCCTLHTTLAWIHYFITGSLYLLTSFTFLPSLHFLPLGTTNLFSVYVSFFFLSLISSFFHFPSLHSSIPLFLLSFHICEIIRLFALYAQLTQPNALRFHMLSQMGRFHFFLCSSNIPLYECMCIYVYMYIYATFSLSIHPLMCVSPGLSYGFILHVEH